MLSSGANWNFAPNLDVPLDIRWGRVYETFSDDPKLVSLLGSAYVEGLQGGRVLSTLKHYIGMGSMGWDTSTNKNFRIDQGVTEADEELLYANYLPPFTAAIDAGSLSVMVGLNMWGDKKMVLQKHLLTDVLKNELGFKGFVVSDWYGVHEGRKNIFGATVSSINAGVDMVMLPFDYKTFAWHMKLAHRLGLISEERINDAVGRILYAKFSLGLFGVDESTDTGESGVDAEHRALARQAVAQSLVLLKNDNEVLPIDPRTHSIRVAGSAADNVGRQMGAWSIEWQGVDGNWPEGSTSLLEGIRLRAPKSTHIEYDILGDFTDEQIVDLGIAIVGEKPYAEGMGDSEFPVLSAEDLRAIENLKEDSKKVLVIIVSGRPLLIEHEVDSIEALVAAWLPGSEGQGVADVLFGDKPFTGTLPLPWPLRSEQLPLAVDGTTADGSAVLFPRNFGLTK
jgi:beta-glucosidase